MKFCKEHWDKLREDIDAAGLSHLIAKTGEAAVKRLMDMQAKKAVPPDPLIECHNMILQRAIEVMGTGIMMKNDAEGDGHYCPICEANKNMAPHPETKRNCGDEWIATIVPFIKDEYRKEGWLNLQ